MRAARRSAIAVAAAATVALVVTSGAHAGALALIRVDQLGFTPKAPKQAFLMEQGARPSVPARARFVVLRGSRVVLRGRLGRDEGAWSARFRGVYEIDFSRLRQTGTFRVAVPSTHARSPLFRIAPAASLYAEPAANAVRFFTAQRDGAAAAGGPLDRQPSHLLDRSATVYASPTAAQLRSGSFTRVGGPVDVEGGWFDAGDYLKFVETASFSDVLMLWAERDHPGAIPGLAAEARIGIDWLERMYDPGSRTLRYQVGIGDGNGDRLLADHDLWRQPQRDDHLTGRPARWLQHRPVFAAGPPGAPISPNLAGRVAAAFGLCAQVYRTSDPAYADRCLSYGEAVYDQAKTVAVKRLLSSAPHAYYPETSWRDDMALGATELYRALSQTADRSPFRHPDPVFYLNKAGRWANSYAGGHGADLDSMNLYDVEALTDFDLARALVHPPEVADVPTDPHALAADLRDQLRLGLRSAARHPFGLANPNTWPDSVAHALGYALTAQFYDRLTHGRTYAAFGQHQLDWVLGANPWGSSFVVGVGSTFPHCLQHQVANLAGSLTGHGALLLGATVAGPTAANELHGLGAPDGYRRCSAGHFARFDGRGAAYLDDVRSAATSEPSDDVTALALLAFAERS